MSEKREIEIKFPLLNADEVVGNLNKVAEFRYETRQIDQYFNAPHRDFTLRPKICEWLRLRTSNGKYSINYKDYSPETYCREYETQIASLEDLELLLKALGFQPLVTVDKIRKVFDLEDAEVSIDEVSGLGSYIEIEYKGNKDNVKEIRARLFDLLKATGAKVGELDKRGYPYELLIKSGLVKA